MKRGLVPFALASLLAAQANAFELKSPDISAQRPIAEKFVFNSFGCKGENISPALEWTDPPAGTKSFAVLVHDPDAPTGGAGFWHWIVTDIPASAHGLAQGAGTPDGKGLARRLETARQRLRRTRLGRPLPAGRTWPTSLCFHGLRAPHRNARPARERANGIRRLHRQQQGAGQGDADRDLRPLKSRRRRRYVIDAAGSSYRGGVRLPAGAAGARRPSRDLDRRRDRRARQSAQSRPADAAPTARRAGSGAAANYLFLHRFSASAGAAGAALWRDPAGAPRLHPAGAALPPRACR